MTENQEELLQRLFVLVPAPEHPIATNPGENDWRSVEKQIGITLPGDYKAIIDRYGAGDFCDDLLLLNPFCDKEDLNLVYQIGPEPELYGPMVESYIEGRSSIHAGNCPFAVYPEIGGLLPMATDSLGRDLFWLTGGAPSTWTIVRYEGRAGWLHEHIKSSLGEFLFTWISRQIAKLSEKPTRNLAAKMNPVFCPLGQVRNYAKTN